MARFLTATHWYTRRFPYVLFVILTFASVVTNSAQADVLINGPMQIVGNPALASGPTGVLYAVVEDLTLPWFYVYESTDGGETWTYLTGGVSGPSGFETANPSIAVGDGTNGQQWVFVAYEATQPDQSKSVEVFFFNPDSTSASNIITIESGIDTNDDIHPEICTDSPAQVGAFGVYLVYNRQVGIDSAHQVVFTHSTDQGASWGTPQVIAACDLETRQRPHIAFGGPIGLPGNAYRLFVAYEKAVYVGGSWRNNVFLRVSRDYGTTWDNPVALTSSTDDQYDARVAAAAGSTTVEVVYTTNYQNSGNLDIHYAYSTSAGVSWTTDQHLAASGDIEQSPDIAIVGKNRFHCVYWKSNDVYYSWTDDITPTSWATPAVINDGHTVSATHTRPAVCALRSGVEEHEGSIAWTDTRGASIDTYFDRAQWPPVYMVQPDGSGDFPTIQDAIRDAVLGGLILLGDGTFTGDGNRDIDFHGKALTVRSESGNPEACIINCQGSQEDPHFGFVFGSHEARDTRLEGVTITNGYVVREDDESLAFAGGITTRQASPTIRNVVLMNNRSLVSSLPIPIPCPEPPYGHACAGGMACCLPDSQGANPRLEDCAFDGNTVSLDLSVSPTGETELIALAGGLALFNCAPDMDPDPVDMGPDPAFLGNSVSFTEILDYVGDIAAAGGVAGARAAIELMNSAVMHNSLTLAACSETADAEVVLAGGIACLGSSLAADTCDISDNVISATPIPLPRPPSPLGGGVALLGSSFHLGECTFVENRCEQSGAVALADSVLISGAAGLRESIGTVTSCDFLGNSFEFTEEGNTFGYVETAGALAKSRGALEVSGCQIVQNVASLVGEATEVLGSGGSMLTREGATMVDCDLEENQIAVAGAIDEVVAGGAAGCSEFSVTTLSNCRLIANEARVDSTGAGARPGFAVVGGGVACSAENLVADGSVFEANSGRVHVPSQTSLAGGMACSQSSPQIANCLFNRNEAERPMSRDVGSSIAGGLACRNSSPEVVDCTFTHNRGDSPGEGDCGGIASTSGSFPLIENTIITFSTLGVAVQCDESSSTSLACSGVYGNADGDWVGCIAEQGDLNGNLSADPRFCDPNAGDLRLAADSPYLPENNECSVLIGAYGQGCDLPVAAVSEQERTFTGLIGGHPNPFNPRITILFSLARSQQVRLSIHDLAGRRIVLLADGVFASGEHQAVWEGRNQYGQPVATGVYFARLQADGVAEIQKLVLLK